MKNDNSMRVTIIGDLWILTAFIFLLPVLLSCINLSIDTYLQFPLYFNIFGLNENISRIIIFIIIVMISYLYLKMKRVGYVLMLVLNIYSLLGQYMYYTELPILAIIQLVYFIPTYKYYKKLDCPKYYQTNSET